MNVPILDESLNLAVAVALGAAIGLERQWRQRLAGLRTNTLVALGAATFILVGRLLDADAGAARIGAQVVSGIGFLGAGVIFKEGLNVRGLNTAATLWCAAAVGLLSGAGFWRYAAICAALVIATNLLFRPLVRAINRQPVDHSEAEYSYVIAVVCQGMEEERVRAGLLQGLTETPNLRLLELESRDLDDSNRVEITATVMSHNRREIALETIVGRLSLDPHVTRTGWKSLTQAV
jgi:putative Mg2+ transporter-C (MgtC) family protein